MDASALSGAAPSFARATDERSWQVQGKWRECYVRQVKRSVEMGLQVEDLEVFYLQDAREEA